LSKKLAALRRRASRLLRVSTGCRATGIGGGVSDRMDSFAGDAGDTELAVFTTPTENTARLYLSLGYELMARPPPALYELEAEDVHLRGAL
jgi:hypothetical protein